MKHPILLVFAFMLCLGYSAPTLANDEYGVVLQSATFWIGPPTRENSMAYLRIPKGVQVRILEEEGDYYRVNHKELIGYVERKLVQKLNGEEPPLPEKVAAAPAPTRATGYFRITTETSLRENPNSKATVLVRLPVDGRVEILDKSEKYWWKVKYNSKTGWAKAALLSAE